MLLKNFKNFKIFKIFFIVVFVFMFAKCQNKEVKKEYYDNGQVRLKAHYQDGRLNGVRKLYYKDGQINEIAYYEDDKIEDTLKRYYPNGQLKLLAPYEGGKENGIVKIFYKSGDLQRELELVNGEENGLYKSYFKNGQLRMRALKEGDTITRFYQEFNKDGSFKEEFREIKVNPEYDTVRVGEPYQFQVSSYGPMRHYDSVKVAIFFNNVDSFMRPDSIEYFTPMFFKEKGLIGFQGKRFESFQLRKEDGDDVIGIMPKEDTDLFVEKSGSKKTFEFQYTPKDTGAHYFMGYYQMIPKDTSIIKKRQNYAVPVRFYVKGKRKDKAM